MSKLSKVVALVPIKANSNRVPRKNLRPFHEERSLLDIKLEQLARSKTIERIYVSSESDEVGDIAEKSGAIFLKRDYRLILDETPWAEVLCGVLEQVPVDEETFIAWAPATSPLFERYDEAVAMLSDPFDSVMSLTPHKHYFMNPDYLPINFQWGVWASFTQNLKPLYQMNCALWLARKGKMLRNRFQVGDRPTFLLTDAIEGIDIDTMDEFEMAQYFYQKRFGG